MTKAQPVSAGPFSVLKTFSVGADAYIGPLIPGCLIGADVGIGPYKYIRKIPFPLLDSMGLFHPINAYSAAGFARVPLQ